MGNNFTRPTRYKLRSGRQVVAATAAPTRLHKVLMIVFALAVWGLVVLAWGYKW